MHDPDLIESYLVAQKLNDDIIVYETNMKHVYSLKFKNQYLFDDIYLWDNDIRVKVKFSQIEYFKQLFLIKNNLIYDTLKLIEVYTESTILIKLSDSESTIKTMLLLEDFILSYEYQDLMCSFQHNGLSCPI